MFDRDAFVEACRKAAPDGTRAVREVVEEAVRDSQGIAKALGEPSRGGVEKLYIGPDVSVLHVAWAPYMSVSPHDHGMWAVIGVYKGAEDSIFWRRQEEGLEAAGAKSLRNGEVLPLGPDVVHSVLNPIGRITGALHIYGGDFLAQERSEWDPQSFQRIPCTSERTLQAFERANAMNGWTATA
jgi:predicted metal-dependent enzyme (double-stranded beta helix superfamily)